MNIKTVIISLIFSFLLFSCGTEKYVEPEFLVPPSNLTIYPKNNKIKIQFYSSNIEDKFDGFNIYISTSSSLKNQSGLLPVNNPTSGSIPTISMTSKQINPNIPIQTIIERDSNDKLIENGIRYYIIVKAHSIRNYKSQPCNEAYSTPRNDNLEGLIIYNNEGFNFNNLNKTTPYDFKFIIIDNKPYLTAQNTSLIQSMGYYDNWELINEATEEGYVNNTIPLQIKEGYVFLIKTGDTRYGKIQIKEVNTAGTSYIKFIWAFQQNLNNRDI